MRFYFQQKYYNITLETPKQRIPAYNSNVSAFKKEINRRQAAVLVIFLFGVIFTACSSESSDLLTAEITATSGSEITSSGELASEEAFWRDALAAEPDNPEANYRLGLILAITAPDAAGQYFEAAITNNPALAAQIDRIIDALRIGKLSENPAYRLTLLGQALGALQEWELATSALERATQQDPNYAEAWAYLGEAQQQTGEDGFQALNTALTLDADSYAANLLMALYWRRNDSPAEALELLLTAAEQDPNNLSLQEDIANTYAESGQVETGLTILQTAAEASPEQSLVWQMLARLSLNYDIQLEEVGLLAARQAVLLDGEDPIG